MPNQVDSKYSQKNFNDDIVIHKTVKLFSKKQKQCLIYYCSIKIL